MKRSLLIPLIIACALFMEQIDSTVIATALPLIARDLHEDPISLKLALTSYLVSLAAFIPASGWVADRFGARTVFRAAIGVFVGGSILCGLSGSLATFVGARFIQGIGGAMMVPVGRLVILRSVPKSDLVQALSYLTIPALLGPMIGPPLGGFIATYFHWRWIFFINIPMGIVGVLLATRFIENIKMEGVAPLDWNGFLLLAPGLSLAMLGLATLGRELVPQSVSLGCCALGTVALVAYWLHARRAKHPLLDLTLFRIPTFTIGVMGGSLYRVAIGALPFLLPLMFQLGFGLSPFRSGLLTFASSIGSMFIKTLTKRILGRFGFRFVLTRNAWLCAGSLATMACFTASTPHLVIIGILLLGGCIRSLQFTSINALSYADIDTPVISQATSISSVVQQLSLGMGVTFGAFALTLSNHLQGHTTLVARDFPPAFIAIAVLALSSLLFLRKLHVDAGAEVAGRVTVAEAVGTAKHLS